RELVALHDLAPLDDLLVLRTPELLPDAGAARLVQHVERQLLGMRRDVEPDRDRHETEADGPGADGARRHEASFRSRKAHAGGPCQTRPSLVRATMLPNAARARGARAHAARAGRCAADRAGLALRAQVGWRPRPRPARRRARGALVAARAPRDPSVSRDRGRR